jgi:hypothetical protein
MAPTQKKTRQARVPQLLAAIKSHTGLWLSADEWIMHSGIEERKVGMNAIGSFVSIAKRNGFPLEIKGTGDNKLYRWTDKEGDDQSGVDALILLKFGDRQSVEFKLEHARQIYQQLHALFGGAK